MPRGQGYNTPQKNLIAFTFSLKNWQLYFLKKKNFSTVEDKRIKEVHFYSIYFFEPYLLFLIFILIFFWGGGLICKYKEEERVEVINFKDSKILFFTRTILSIESRACKQTQA